MSFQMTTVTGRATPGSQVTATLSGQVQNGSQVYPAGKVFTALCSASGDYAITLPALTQEGTSPSWGVYFSLVEAGSGLDAQVVVPVSGVAVAVTELPQLALQPTSVPPTVVSATSLPASGGLVATSINDTTNEVTWEAGGRGATPDVLRIVLDAKNFAGGDGQPQVFWATAATTTTYSRGTDLSITDDGHGHFVISTASGGDFGVVGSVFNQGLTPGSEDTTSTRYLWAACVSDDNASVGLDIVLIAPVGATGKQGVEVTGAADPSFGLAPGAGVVESFSTQLMNGYADDAWTGVQAQITVYRL
jgi:hypothetical protein